MKELLTHVKAELTKPQEEISDELLFLINSRIKPPKPVAKEDVFVRTMFLVSDEVNSYGGRFPLDELDKLTHLVIDSPVLIGHTKEKLPIARNFKAEIVQRGGQNWMKVWFYWLRNSKDALSLKDNIDHGIYKECSLGFVFEFPQCSICGQDMRKCPHIPFKSYETQDGEKEAYFNYRNVSRVLETSLVYRGAVPNTSMSDELGLYHIKEIEGQIADKVGGFDSKDQHPHVHPLDFVHPTNTGEWHSTSNIVFHDEDLCRLSGKFLVEPKYEGIRTQIHKNGDQVKIFSEQGEEIQPCFPLLAEEMLRIPQESFILDGQLVKYKGNSRLSHEEAAGYVAQALNTLSGSDRPLPDDSHFKFKAFDLLYLNGENKTSLPLEERKQLLEQFFEDTPCIQKVKYEKAVNANLIAKVKGMATSDGAMLKRCDSVYFDAQSWFEWRRHLDLDAVVMGFEKNKKGSYNHLCAIGTTENPSLIGTTYSTFLRAKEGEIIRVRVESIDQASGGFVWHAPKVLEKRSDKREPDSLSVLHRMVDRSTSTAKDLEAADGGRSTADRFVLQVHRGGGSKHHNLRFQNDGLVFGFTLYKMDLEGLSRGRRYLCEWKEHTDLKWMDIEGEIPPQEERAEENPSKEHGAHIKRLDSGKYRFLEKQPDFSRLEMEGGILKGVYLVRKVRLNGNDRWLFWKRSTKGTVNGSNG